MFLMYVDESGDTGIQNSPTSYFGLSAFIVHKTQWRSVLDDYIQFRRGLKSSFGLKLREEIHASHMINSPGPLYRIKRNIRLDILKYTLRWCATQPNCRIINVLVDKRKKQTSDTVFELAWKILIQRFENALQRGSLPLQTPNDYGLMIPDRTDDKKLTELVRKMRYFNMVPSQFGGASLKIPIAALVEDPFFKDSSSSYFHQIADVNAYFLTQLYSPNAYIRKNGARTFFRELLPVLLTQASRKNPLGIDVV